MAKKAQKTASAAKRSVLSVSLSTRDMKGIENFVAREGSSKRKVIEEAIDALRVKRQYEAKRSIERPALPPKRDSLNEISDRPLMEAIPIDNRIREYVPNQLSQRPRLTTNVDTALMEELEALVKRSGRTKADLLRTFIEEGVDPFSPKRDRRDVVSRKTEVVFYSNLFIKALEEALDFDPMRHHNAPPPALRLENADYLQEIRMLIGELKRLNDNLESAASAAIKPKTKRAPAPRKAVEKSAIEVKKHINTFLNKYASTLGTGAAALTIGTAAALLQQLGVPFDAIIRRH